jgi:hypothetical protein
VGPPRVVRLVAAMCILFPATPPAKSKRKGAGGKSQDAMIAMQDNPNTFDLALKNAACKDPCCCCIGTCGTVYCGLSSCWARKSVLEAVASGIPDFICCQGYAPKCGPCNPESCCPGSPIGLCLEGCLCPVLSISVARIHIMEKRAIQPDPCDYQIIQCSNFLQLLACICQIAAMFEPALEELAEIIGCIADIFTYSVSGCMIAQLNAELKKGGKVHPGGPEAAKALAYGGPEGEKGLALGAPPKSEEMVR